MGTTKRKVSDVIAKNRVQREETPGQKAIRDKRANALGMVAMWTPEGVVKSLSQLKLQVNGVIDDMSNKMVAQATQLREASDAINAQKQELEAVHGISVQADSLESLLLAHETERAAFAQEMQELQRLRQRDEDEYQYNLRKRHQEELDKLTRELKNHREAFENEISAAHAALTTRENAIQAKEQEFAALQAEVVKLRNEQVAEISKQVSIACNSLKKDLENKHALEKMALDNTCNLLRAEITTVRGHVATLEKEKTDLVTRYQDATKSVQAIAERAIDGASKQATHVHVPTPDTVPGKR
jgi:colicin import membrane protein